MPHSVDRPLHRSAPLTRRVVLHGAAWAVPAVALVAATPAYAGSGPTLTFSSPSYSGVACGTITDATVSAADGAAPKSGVVIALSLSGGYTFDGGGTSATVTTGANGSVSCGTIHVPAGTPTGALTASASGATGASATLSAYDARVLASPSGLDVASAIPSGSTPVAQDFFLASGVLYRAGVGSLVSGVQTVGRPAASPTGAATFLLPLSMADGSFAVYDTAAAALTPVAGMPAQTVPLAGDLFRAGATIYRGGAAVATDVDAPGQLIEHDGGNGSSGQFWLPYRSTSGAPRILRLPSNDVRTAYEYGAANGPGSGATPIADDLFLSQNQIFRVSWDGTSAYGAGPVASGVTGFGALTPNPYYSGERLLAVTLSGGQAAMFMVSGNALRSATQVPAGATPVGADLFASNGSIYQDAVGAVASDVAQYGLAGPSAVGSNRVIVPLTTSTSTC